MVPIYYNPSYVCSGYSFDTTRKAGWIAESLERDPIDGIEIRKDLMYEIYVRESIEAGLADADAGRVVSHEDAISRIRARIRRAS